MDPWLYHQPAYRTPEKARNPRLFATPVGAPSTFCLTESYIQRTSKTAFSFARAMNHHFRCFPPPLLVTSCIQRSTREASGHVFPQTLRPRFKASFYQETCLDLLFEVLRGKLGSMTNLRSRVSNDTGYLCNGRVLCSTSFSPPQPFIRISLDNYVREQRGGRFALSDSIT